MAAHRARTIEQALATVAQAAEAQRDAIDLCGATHDLANAIRDVVAAFAMAVELGLVAVTLTTRGIVRQLWAPSLIS